MEPFSITWSLPNVDNVYQRALGELKRIAELHSAVKEVQELFDTESESLEFKLNFLKGQLKTKWTGCMISTHTSLEDLFVKTSEDHVTSSLDLVKSRHQVEFGHMLEAFSGLFSKFTGETSQIVQTFSTSVEEMTTLKEES